MPIAKGGINGTYEVRGTENDNGDRYKFTGTVKVSKFKAGSYSLTFNDGERASSSFKFNFSTPLKETTSPQTVNCYSSRGTGTATFRFVNGHYKLEFTYKAKGANVRGSGTGSK